MQLVHNLGMTMLFTIFATLFAYVNTVMSACSANTPTMPWLSSWASSTQRTLPFYNSSESCFLHVMQMIKIWPCGIYTSYIVHAKKAGRTRKSTKGRSTIGVRITQYKRLNK